MRVILRWWAVLFFVPFTVCPADLVPRLVRDVDPTSYAGSSSPRQFISLEHGFGFTAFGGREIWTYDDQEDVLGPALKRAEIRQLVDNLFASREASGGWRFWHVEGFPYYTALPIGKQELRRLGAVYVSPFGAQTGILFEAAGAGHGLGLWTVHSFSTGPVEIARPLPLPGGRLLRDLTSFGDGERSFFVARHPRLGLALWTTDFTAAGTHVIFALATGTANDLAIVGVSGKNLLLAVSGSEPALWVSNGTARGTRPLTRIGRGPATITKVDPLRPFLLVDDGRHGRQLWLTDGTAAGTRQLTRFAVRDAFGGTPPVIKLVGQHWVFFADDGAHGRELWRTDGPARAPTGAHLLADLCPGACGTTGDLLLTLPAVAPLPERLLLTAQTPGLGNELWVTDGTATGTALVRDLCEGPCDADPRDATVVGSFADFNYVATFTAAVSDGGDGTRALWRSDGTPEGTARLTPAGVTASTGIQLNLFDDNFFAASDAEFGDEIWTTGGTPETTHIWRDLQREADIGSYPLPFAAAGGKLLFTAFDPLHQRQLWASDGSAAGTVRIPVLAPSTDFFKPPAASLGESAVFVARGRGAAKTALWGTDGSAAGTVPLTPPEVEAGGFFFPPYALGTRALFFATDAAHGTELWVSEGTPATTHLVVDLAPGPQSIDVAESLHATLRGQMVFGRRDDGDGHLWLTDGTAEGTRRMVDVYPFLAPIEQASSFAVAEIQGKLFFIGRIPGDDGSGVDQLWISDWTAAGTHATDLVDIHGGETFFFPTASRLYIQDFLGQGGEAFWVTDGTPGGTALLPINSDPSSPAPRPIVFGERLVLTNENGQLVATDGTAAGTFVLQDPAGDSISTGYGGGISFAGHLVFSAGNGFNPCFVWDGTGDTMIPADGVQCTGQFTAAGSRLFFPGFEPRTGAELWVFEEK